MSSSSPYLDRHDTIEELEVILEMLKMRAIGATMESLEALIERLKVEAALDNRAYCIEHGLPAHLFHQ